MKVFSYSYDDQGRLESYTPALPAGYGSITYTWGLQGQKTSMTVPMGNNSAKKYSYYYDKEGRQVGMDVEAVSVTSSPTLTAGTSDTNIRFFYDDNENRVKLITKSGDAYYFVYDPTASIPAVVYEAVGATAYLNVREPSGALISREKYVSGVYQYSRTYHFDGLGSTIALTDEDGVTTDTYSYDAWGNVTPGQYNQTTDNPYQYVGKFGYYTHYQDPDFKLLQLGVRYYDPNTGRFTQIDPIRDGINWYAYVDNRPTTSTDPSGLSQSLLDMEKEMLSCLFNCMFTDKIKTVAEIIKKYGAVIIAACFDYRGNPWNPRWGGVRNCISTIYNAVRNSAPRLIRNTKCRSLAIVGLAIDAIDCSQKCIRKLGAKWGVW